MKSVSQHSFARVPKAEIQRSTFDRSSTLKTTFDAGFLPVVFVDEALPGDTFNLNMSIFGRLATPLKPIMDNLHLETFFFAVPYRILWENWERLNGAQDNPGDSTDYLVPQVTGTNVANGTLWDYMGLPTNVTGALSVSALPFRAYNLIWNEWFRDQNLQDSLPVNKGDGPDLLTDYVLKRRGKRHDYFTSCLPFVSKGPDVPLPLGSSAPIISNDNVPQVISPTLVTARNLQANSGNSGISHSGATGGTLADIKFGPETGLEVDLSTATASTINALREAFQLQRLLERDARGGTRYFEILQSHFQITSPDSRLQRPEYLGGGWSPINIHPVAQTSGEGTYTSTPQGNLAGFGTVTAHGHGFVKSFVEHSIIIGLACVRADLTYQNGIHKMWSRRTRYDFYLPSLAHLGEQAVLNREIYAQGTAADDDVFGYQERFGEMRYGMSKITGKFRSTDPQSLDIWHLAQDFAALPLLNGTFIEENPPVDRVSAVTTEPDILFDSVISLKCARPMPVFGVPGYIDHF